MIDGARRRTHVPWRPFYYLPITASAVRKSRDIACVDFDVISADVMTYSYFTHDPFFGRLADKDVCYWDLTSSKSVSKGNIKVVYILHIVSIVSHVWNHFVLS